MAGGPRVAVVGAGYVGCVTAACLARRGLDVLAVDTDPGKVAELRAGRSPILEPGLPALIAEGVAQGRLRAAEPTAAVLRDVDVAVVCVSTPSMPDGSVDVRPLRRVLASLAEAAAGKAEPLVVVVRSTVAPNRLRALWGELAPAAARTMRLVANPEFLREATAIADFETPPFLIFGGDDEEAVRRAAAVFEPDPTSPSAPVHVTTLETALLVKYASNAYHGLKIAFANEIAVVASSVGADPLEVMRLFAEDRVLNVSKAYLRPGFAFGGSCLPKDIRALVSLGREAGRALPVLGGVLLSNADRIEEAAAQIAASGARRVALLGVSFKAGTDDLRESPYLLLAGKLVGRGLTVCIHDPDVDPARLLGGNRDYLDRALPDFERLVFADLDAAVQGADAIALCKRVAPPARLASVLAHGARLFDLEYLAPGSGGKPVERPVAVR